MIIRARKCLWHNVKLRWCRVQTVVVHVDSSWLYYEALRASAELKHSLFSVIFTAIFVPKNKIHRKYVHLFRPKNKRPKNKKVRFSAPKTKKKTKKKTKFGRPLLNNQVGLVKCAYSAYVRIARHWNKSPAVARVSRPYSWCTLATCVHNCPSMMFRTCYLRPKCKRSYLLIYIISDTS